MNTKQVPSVEPGRLISSGTLPRLTELAQVLPDLSVTAGEKREPGSQEGIEIERLNPAEWINQLAEVTHAYQAAYQLVQAQDELLGQTLASFGRI
jgi:hypothetical protein